MFKFPKNLENLIVQFQFLGYIVYTRCLTILDGHKLKEDT